MSHVGSVRRLNEDSCLDHGSIGLWVVADGMGGHHAGDLASQLIVNTLAALGPQSSLAAFVDAVEDGILAANDRLVRMGAETRQTSGSTVVALLAHGRHGAVLWAGDSRLYRYRDGRLEQISRDHSQIELYVERGLLTREEAIGHPAANMVTRAVGASADLRLEADVFELLPGDRYLLCSDGLDKHVSDELIAGIVGTGTPAQAAQALIDATLERGAHDNVTVALVEIAGPEGRPDPAPGDAVAGSAVPRD